MLPLTPTWKALLRNGSEPAEGQCQLLDLRWKIRMSPDPLAPFGAAWNHGWPPFRKAHTTGFEPALPRSTGECSTAELHVQSVVPVSPVTTNRKLLLRNLITLPAKDSNLDLRDSESRVLPLDQRALSTADRIRTCMLSFRGRLHIRCATAVLKCGRRESNPRTLHGKQRGYHYITATWSRRRESNSHIRDWKSRAQPLGDCGVLPVGFEPTLIGA